MSKRNFFNVFAGKLYDVNIKDKDNKQYTQYIVKYKKDAITIAKELLKYFIYSEVVYRPTGEIIWKSKEVKI